jgi:hypothetical protein
MHVFQRIALALTLTVTAVGPLRAQVSPISPECREPTPSALLHQLESTDPERRAEAIYCLVERRPPGVSLVRIIARVLDRDTSVRARAVAMHSLYYLGHAARPALRSVLRQVKSDQRALRQGAWQALPWLGLDGLGPSQRAAVIAAALAALSDTIEMVRHSALEALAAVGPTAASALAQASMAADSFIAVRAIGFMCHNPWDAALARVLSASLGDSRAAVRRQAARCFVGYGSTSEALLRRLRSDSSPLVRAAADSALRLWRTVASSRVLGRCYHLRLSMWEPYMSLGEDSTYIQVPRVVQFTARPHDMPWGDANAMRLEPARGVGYSVHGPGAWHTASDSIYVVWTTGFSGVTADLGIRSDTLRGTATTFWDSGRAQQRARLTGVPIACH